MKVISAPLRGRIDDTVRYMKTGDNHRMIRAILAAIAIWLACPLEAHAALQSSVDAVISSMKYIPFALSVAAYMYGAGTVLAGAWKLKSHAEEPSKTPIMQGVTRIAIGGTVSSLPALIGYVNNSLRIGDIKLLFHSMGKIA